MPPSRLDSNEQCRLVSLTILPWKENSVPFVGQSFNKLNFVPFYFGCNFANSYLS